jgi:hypothetical protein
MVVNPRRTSRFLPCFKRASGLLLSLAVCVVVSGAAMASATPRHVVSVDEIQARLDQQLDRDSADRQEILALLSQPGVRQIAESAGLDVQRAHAATALLSGQELRDLASRAREVNAGVGGDRTVTITATTLIIILLIVIIVMD